MDGELVGSDIGANLTCNRYGNANGWSHSRLTRTFASPIDDFRLLMSGSWDSGGPSAIQRVDVLIQGPNIRCSVDDTTHNADAATPFCFGPGGGGQLPAVSGTSDGTFLIERCNGEIKAFFNGSPVLSGAYGQAVTGVQLHFGYYKVDHDPADPTNLSCVDSGPYSTFGEIRIDSLFFEGPPPASYPVSVCGF